MYFSVERAVISATSKIKIRKNSYSIFATTTLLRLGKMILVFCNFRKEGGT
jgi:hypothetical protein